MQVLGDICVGLAARLDVFFAAHKEKIYCVKFSELFHNPLNEYQENGVLREQNPDPVFLCKGKLLLYGQSFPV